MTDSTDNDTRPFIVAYIAMIVGTIAFLVFVWQGAN